MNKSALIEFLYESNKIEGIHREPTESEIGCAEMFLGLQQVTLNDLKAVQSAIAPVGSDLGAAGRLLVSARKKAQSAISGMRFLFDEQTGTEQVEWWEQ